MQICRSNERPSAGGVVSRVDLDTAPEVSRITAGELPRPIRAAPFTGRRLVGCTEGR